MTTCDLNALLLPGEWQSVDITVSGWAEYRTVQYRLEGDIVRVVGAVVRTDGSTGSAVVFTLPSGYQPSEERILNGGTGLAGPTTVGTNGDVTVDVSTGSSLAVVSGTFPL